MIRLGKSWARFSKTASVAVVFPQIEDRLKG